MTVNQKLNKVMEFLIQNKDRHNINPHTIHETIFEKSIPYTEAQLLHRKLLESGYVRVVSDKFLAYSLETEQFLIDGGYGGEYSSDSPESSVKNHVSKVFVTYAWGNPIHEDEVRRLTNHLRDKGFHAEVDRMLTQDRTTLNLKKMMYLAMQYDKVIVVLSPTYKQKADEFKGGVGTEYTILINDIDEKPNKYILVTLDGITKDIIPFGLAGNEIVDLSKPDGEDKLFRKLTGVPEFEFSPVASQKTVLTPEKIGPFAPVKPENIFSIEKPAVTSGNRLAQGGLYTWVEFTLTFRFKNISNKTIEGLHYTVKYKQELNGNEYMNAEDGYITNHFDFEKKIFPSAISQSETIILKVQSHQIRQVLASKIFFTLYTEYGTLEREFPIEDLLQVTDPVKNYMPKQPLNADLFNQGGLW